MPERSDKIYEYYRDSAIRFDYFMTGGTGALAAYIGQTLKPQRIGLNPESLELLALLLLVGSIIAGLKRIEEGVEIHKFNHKLLEHRESHAELISTAMSGGGIDRSTGQMVTPSEMMFTANLHKEATDQVWDKLEKMMKLSVRYYNWRNRLLLLGFLLLIVARILPAYLAH